MLRADELRKVITRPPGPTAWWTSFSMDSPLRDMEMPGLDDSKAVSHKLRVTCELCSAWPSWLRCLPVEQVSGCDVVVEAVSDWSRSRLLNQVVEHGGIEMAE